MKLVLPTIVAFLSLGAAMANSPGEQMCCWPIDPLTYASFNGVCEAIIDIPSVQARIRVSVEANLPSSRRLVSIGDSNEIVTSAIEDSSENVEDMQLEVLDVQVSNIRSNSKKARQNLRRNLLVLDFGSFRDDLMAEQCAVPGVPLPFLPLIPLEPPCDDCGSDPTCYGNLDICSVLVDISIDVTVTIRTFLGPFTTVSTADIKSMPCKDDPEDCCVQIDYVIPDTFWVQLGIAALRNPPVFVPLGAILLAGASLIELPAGKVDFRTSRVFTRICDKLYGDFCPDDGVGDGGMLMDPHIKSWTGEWFDYMGECDLTLVHAPLFDGERDLNIHVRTTIRYDYSYIESAAIRIGEDILEVSSWGEYAFNGVEGALTSSSDALAPINMVTTSIGGYPIYHVQEKVYKSQDMILTRNIFDIVLNERENVTISNMKDLVNVKINHTPHGHFGGAVGMMGNFHGQMLARDGDTDLHKDMNALAQEWQVRDTDPKLFSEPRAPQYPDTCRLPEIDSKETRRLGEGISEEAAKAACAHLHGNTNAFEACVYDVTATNDLDQAHSGAY